MFALFLALIVSASAQAHWTDEGVWWDAVDPWDCVDPPLRHEGMVRGERIRPPTPWSGLPPRVHVRRDFTDRIRLETEWIVR